MFHKFSRIATKISLDYVEATPKHDPNHEHAADSVCLLRTCQVLRCYSGSYFIPNVYVCHITYAIIYMMYYNVRNYHMKNKKQIRKS